MLFTEEELLRCTATKGDLLVCEGGDVGRSAIWDYDYDICIQNHIHRIRAYVPLCTRYFLYLLMLNKSIGLIGGKGIGIQGFSAKALHNTIVALPPLAEQKRIVGKIEELMPLVEEYDKAQKELDELNTKLPEALKKSILQQAIQGKLVPQDPNDEPASELLKRIRKEKEQLVKDGKLKKKDLETTPIPDDEKPFEIPDSWEWVRLSVVSEIIGGFAFPSQDIKSEIGTRVIRISDFNEQGWVNSKVARYNDRELLSQYELKIGDILIAMTGGTVGKSLYVKQLPERMLLNQRVAIVRNSYVLSSYIDLLIKAPLIQEVVKERKNSTNDNISMADITGFLIPLPPLAEQKRIVEKIEELFGLLKV